MAHPLDSTVTTPDAPCPDPVDGPVNGHVDGIADGVLCGWAWAPGHPGRALRVEVRQGERLVAAAAADQYRPDLEAAGIGDGRHAFTIPLPPASRPARRIRCG